MKNILTKSAESIEVLVEAIIGAINKWFDGKKIIITSLALSLITIMEMYLGYDVISYAWAAFWTGLANLVLKAIASGKPIFDTGYKMDTLFFWINLLWFGASLLDLTVNTGILNGHWNLIVATVLILIRMVGMNQGNNHLRSAMS